MTEAIKANLPVLVVIIPLFVAVVLPTFARRFRLVEFLVILAGILGLAASVYLANIVLAQDEMTISYYMGGWKPPWGIELKVDSLAAFFLLVTTVVSLPITLFAKGNLHDEVGSEGRATRFYVLYLLLTGALCGMALTNDLFNVYVLVEVATLSCCGLVSARNHPRAAEAAFTYLILATVGSALVMGGIGFVYINTGHLNMGFAFQELAGSWQSKPHAVWLAASFFLVGFGVKSAVFPLHVWLPDAHSTAPAPASAILSGLAVKGYLICLIKIMFHVFGSTLMQSYAIHKILLLVGMVAILAGAVSALGQKELKRRLAFSTVSHVGYIILGMGLMNTTGLKGTLFYMASHAVIKSTLFLSAGAMISASGKNDIKALAGIGKKMPITMAAFTIASLGLIGIPLFSGFIGKWNLILGGFEAGSVLSIGVIMIGSVLCAAYLFPVIRTAWFEPAPPETSWHDPGLPQKISLILLAAAVVILGVFPGSFLELAGKAAAELLVLR